MYCDGLFEENPENVEGTKYGADGSAVSTGPNTAFDRRSVLVFPTFVETKFAVIFVVLSADVLI